jgi:hypothetical protein
MTTCHMLDPTSQPIMVRSNGSQTFNIFDTRRLPLTAEHLNTQRRFVICWSAARAMRTRTSFGRLSYRTQSMRSTEWLIVPGEIVIRSCTTSFAVRQRSCSSFSKVKESRGSWTPFLKRANYANRDRKHYSRLMRKSSTPKPLPWIGIRRPNTWCEISPLHPGRQECSRPYLICRMNFTPRLCRKAPSRALCDPSEPVATVAPRRSLWPNCRRY